MEGYWLVFAMNMLTFVLGGIAGWNGKSMWDHHMKEKGERNGK